MGTLHNHPFFIRYQGAPATTSSRSAPDKPSALGLANPSGCAKAAARWRKCPPLTAPTASWCR